VSLILAWVFFPLVLAAVGAGWGTLVERAAGSRIRGVLVVPLGLATVIVLALIMTEWSVTAAAAVPVVAVGAAVGLILAWPQRHRPSLWPSLAAVGVVLAYGAPVLLTGQATFTGIVTLDDTSTWLNIIDHAMTNLHPATGVPVGSTYQLTFIGDVRSTYPLGAFMLPAVGHLLTGIDAAWILQPYMALCGAAVALCLYALVEPLIASARVRALIAFIGAQPALLYGYSLWGGDKEMAAAFLLVLGVALVVDASARRPANPRGLLPLAIAAAALIVTLSVGAIAWAGPALIGMIAVWIYRARLAAGGLSRVSKWLGRLTRDVVLLSAATAVLMLPVWLVVSQFISEHQGLYNTGVRTKEEVFGNLTQPLSGWQLAGIWPVGDFRLRAPTVASVLLIGCALIAVAVAVWLSVRRRRFGMVAYVAVALTGCAIFYLLNTTPWVIGKSLAISSPALLAAAMTGAGLLLLSGRRWRVLGALATLAIAGGVLYSNFLAYHDTTIAPRERLAELQHIGDLVAGKGPTFINEYEVYADRHFLHEGEPIEPAEYRPATLALRSGAILTKTAWANLDSFPLGTLEYYRSIVTQRAPAESRPPSIYRLIWQGKYYQLWQRPKHPTTTILEHIPYGEENTNPYCGVSQNQAPHPLCATVPLAFPSCPQLLGFARSALSQHARLVAYSRPVPSVAHGDEVVWPGNWIHEKPTRQLMPTEPGTAVGRIGAPTTGHYELWLYGAFARGFEVHLDGEKIGSVSNQLGGFAVYVPLGNVALTAGVHTITLTYPHAGVGPGSGNDSLTSLTGIVLQPLSPPARLIELLPSQAKLLCGLPLEWLELVTPA
jgi:hypothetical protein